MKFARSLGLASVLATAGAAAAQRVPAFAKVTDPQAIIEAYRRTEPYASLDFAAFERPPFLFLVQKDGSSGLEGIVNLRYFALKAVLDLFVRDFAKPLGLKRRPRVLPYWILNSRASYDRLGGSPFAAAHFSLVELHTVTYRSKTERTHDALHTALHEAVHQIMFAHVDPKTPLHLAAMSAWLMEGMAEHLSARPDEPLLLGRDPKFGTVKSEWLAEVRPYLRRRFTWKRRSKLPWVHHPMEVMLYRTLPDYMRATGQDPQRADDYQQQMAFFYRCSYAIVAFLDRAYRGKLRPKLLKILELEYNTKGLPAAVHGTRAVNMAFTPGEKGALPGLFARFVLDPEGTIKADLPKDWGKTAVPVTSEAGGFFREPGAGKAAVLPEPPGEENLAETPDPVLLARALLALGRFDLDEARRLVEEVDLGPGDDVDDAADGCERLFARLAEVFAAEAAKNKRKPLKVYLREPGPRTRYLAWVVRDWRPKERMLIVERKGTQRTVPLAEVPPYLFGRSLAKLGLLDSKEERLALSVLTGLHLRSLDPRARRAAAKRAAKEGFAPPEELFAVAAHSLDLLDLFLEARRSLLRGEKPSEVLGRLAAKIGKARDPQSLWFVRHRLPGLLEQAFELSPDRLPKLYGKVRLLPRGRVRIDYDWKDPAQVRDWLVVDVKKEGFRTAFGPLGEAGKGPVMEIVKTEADENGRVRFLRQAYLRHRLQFEGDLTVRFRVGSYEDLDDEGNTVLYVTPWPELMIHALRPDSYTLLGSGGLLGFRDGRRRASRRFKRDMVKMFWETVRDEGEFTFRRRGDEVLFEADDELIAKMSAKRLADRGAVILVQHYPSGKDAEHPPMLGEISIEGRPCRVSLEEPRRRFYARWLPRFPALTVPQAAGARTGG